MKKQNGQNTYQIGGRIFSSQRKVAQWMSEIRSIYRDREPITDTVHVAAIYELLAHHVDRKQKVGAGVDFFFVDYSQDHPTRCFWIQRVDGTKTKFGAPACLVSIRTLNIQSLRQAVEPFVTKFKKSRIGNATSFVSDYSGKTFDVDVAHVDHEVPFEKIAEDFFQSAGCPLGDALLTRSTDHTSKPTWIDERLIERFVAHHEGFKLRLVASMENQGVIRRLQNKRG